MAQLMLVNPRKRRRRTSKKKTVARRRPTRRISTRPARKTRRRRNPIKTRGLSGVVNQIMPAATAAVGALGLDLIWGYAPIPESLKTGNMRFVVKAAGAIGLGMLAGMVVKKSTADQLATGALTVVLHNAMRDGMANFAPNIQLGEYMNNDETLGYWGAGYNPGMSEYLPNSNQGDLSPGANLNGSDDYESLYL